jgi:hypothetical protein
MASSKGEDVYATVSRALPGHAVLSRLRKLIIPSFS